MGGTRAFWDNPLLRVMLLYFKRWIKLILVPATECLVFFLPWLLSINIVLGFEMMKNEGCKSLAPQSQGLVYLWIWHSPPWHLWTRGCLVRGGVLCYVQMLHLALVERQSLPSSVWYCCILLCLLLVFKTNQVKYKFPIMCIIKHEQKWALWTLEYLTVVYEQILNSFLLCCSVERTE